MKFEERVLKQEFKLNDTDDEIIAFIRNNRHALNTLSIQDIANEVYSVPNAIMRLAKKLEYTGFSQMKIMIEQENEEVERDNKIPQNVSKTIELINYDALLTVALKMKKCKTVYFLGVGDSIYYCEMMANNLRCINKKAEYYHNYHEIDYRVTHCDEQDVLVFISATGENERLINVAKGALERGVCVISVTHFNKNSLSKICSNALYFWGEERRLDGYNVTDRTGLMILLRELSEVFWREYCI